MSKLQDYNRIIGQEVLDELFLLGNKLEGLTVQNINSTAVGGGVAEILNRMIPLLKEVGINARWDVIKGGEQFFSMTKKMHNAMHGQKESFTDDEFDLFREVNNANLREMDFAGDIIFIHDPQPIALIEKRKEIGRNWLWRCHIDSSAPLPAVWQFLLPYIEQYDAAVFSAPAYAQPIKIKQLLIAPSIDPLSNKNKDLSESEILQIVKNFNLDLGRPVITQVSRFDRLKDPVGVIEAYKIVKKHTDCQLVLAGGSATDDPESEAVLAETREKAGNDPDIHILLLPPTSDIEINALQRISTVIVQKSLREGFGLTVAEALWKEKPVVASSVGGIPLQITHKYSGLLSNTIEGTAYYIRQLLHTPEYAQKLARNGKEHVKQNFLITRHLRDYLLAFVFLKHLNEELIQL
ncbi:MAG: glycosyltransferase [Planctomycetes bacterium]|nr:glycosyltransferase [Planctomycetota bacterium]